ncbi:hypothetical protein DAI22_04g008350 [Oryza sativa Japonica Group]|nr:hypothetical protein DAI22_04g008350 [Oryza sativa Japonica Group]
MHYSMIFNPERKSGGYTCAGCCASPPRLPHRRFHLSTMAAAVRAYCRPIPTRRYPPLPPSPLPAARARHRCPSEPRLPRRPLALPPPPLRRRSPEQPPRRQHLSLVRSGAAVGSRRGRDVTNPGVAVTPPSAARPRALAHCPSTCRRPQPWCTTRRGAGGKHARRRRKGWPVTNARGEAFCSASSSPMRHRHRHSRMCVVLVCCLLLALVAPSVVAVARHDYGEGFRDFCSVHGATIAEGLVCKIGACVACHVGG